MTISPIVVTMGCPAGIGPEIIVKTIDSSSFPCPVVVAGDANVLQRAIEICNVQLSVESWTPGEDVIAKQGVLKCLEVTSLSVDEVPFGGPSETTGRASFAYIEKAVRLCSEGIACAMVTAPISKLGLSMAGIPYPGHTEMLADMTGSKDFLMMMAGSSLKVTLVTIHCALKDVPSLLDVQRVLHTIKITHEGLVKDFGMDSPCIAVCGLNPHAGEDGMFGTEEKEIIEPACDMARNEGIDCIGPLPPDTVFFHAAKGRYDAVVCQYHDQGLIPFKLLHFDDGVNVTLGLPIIRTSVDHGTAYDIAGKGLANPRSLKNAMELAANIAANRKDAGK